MKISPARTAAFDILSRIERERSFSSILLHEYEQHLTPKDGSLCHQLTLGVLRRQMCLDRIIDHFAAGKKMDLPVRLSLRLGLYQLLYLDKVPAYSAVNESVDLVQRARKSSARGFVNAILRRASREPFTARYDDEIERISVESSHPRWLIEKWVGRFGLEDAAHLAEANNSQPTAAFRLTMRASSPPEFEGAEPSKFVPGCFLAASVTGAMTEAAAAHAIYFQDEASQLVGNAVIVPDSGRFLDVCAAPGSKVTQIAARGNGCLFAAGDIHSHRTRFLLENARSQGIRDVAVIRYDAENELPFQEGSFDIVLVDAPCSGTGTIRHNPEIRYFLQSEDLVELSNKQRRILRNASKMVRSGGNLVYSTCSLEVEENEAVADHFLRSETGFAKARPLVPDPFIGTDEYARTTPYRDKMDGFFIASLVRQPSN